MPAQAGIQVCEEWMPACAGMTGEQLRVFQEGAIRCWNS